MQTFIRSRKFFMGASLAGLLVAGGQIALHKNIIGSASAQPPGDPMVPMFQVDPYWPKPLPNHWVQAMTIGLSMDAHDNIWIIHRPQTLEQKESYATRGEADCCIAAPDVLEFNEAGDLLRHWGRDEVRGNGHDWPSSNHGITVDKDGNVWLGGNGAYQPMPPPGSAEQFAPRPSQPAPAPFREGGGERGTYHDSFILKFSPDGKFLGEIGHANGSKGSLDTDNVKGVAQIRIIPQTNELVLADGYGNKRVSVWDAATMKFKRLWGAYGKPPNDDPIPHYDVNSPQFGNPVHCAQPSNDGLIYVCDRTNNRIQVFKFDGTFVKQYIMEPNTKGDGSVWEIAFSKDPQQKFMYIADGSNEKIHVYDRQSMTELYSFGGGGRIPGQFYAVHSIVTDSKGNIFTTETYRGQRVQKFIYKGMVPLSTLLKKHAVGGSLINP
jgi:WD40 repeat protein